METMTKIPFHTALAINFKTITKTYLGYRVLGHGLPSGARLAGMKRGDNQHTKILGTTQAQALWKNFHRPPKAVPEKKPQKNLTRMVKEAKERMTIGINQHSSPTQKIAHPSKGEARERQGERTDLEANIAQKIAESYNLSLNAMRSIYFSCSPQVRGKFNTPTAFRLHHWSATGTSIRPPSTGKPARTSLEICCRLKCHRFANCD